MKTTTGHFILCSVVFFVIGCIVGVAVGGNPYPEAKLTLEQDNVLKTPGKQRPHLNLSTQYFKSGRYGAALDEAEFAIHIAPQSVTGYINAASAAIKLEAYPLAYKYSHDIMRIKPMQSIAQNLVILCNVLGKKEEALQWQAQLKNFKNYDKLDLGE